jgi:phospholipid/cholesterol/gamma-HCH transport system substrate-binding protein
MQSASRVGFLVVVFIGLLVGAYAVLQKSFFAPKTKTYFAEFADAGGVTSGARVLMSGVEIGSVASVELSANRTAKLKLSIRDDVAIPVDSKALLPTSLIGIGDRQIELMASAKSTSIAPEGTTFQGSSKSALEAFAPDSGKTIAALETTLNKANKLLEATTDLVKDKELKQNMNTLMVQSAATAERFGALAARLDKTLSANSGAITQMMRNGKEVSSNIAAVSREFKTYVQKGTLQGNVDKLFAKLNEALDNGNQILASVKSLSSDPAMQDNLKGIIANTKTMTAKGTEIAENAKLLTGKGVEFADEATTLMKKANKLADQAADLMQDLKKRLLPGGGGGPLSDLKKIQASADIMRETNPNRWRSEVTMNVPLGKNSFELGLWDAFESNKITARYGQPIGKGGQLKYGVFASKPGVGVEFPLAPNLRLRGDLFGVNKPRLDLRAGFGITKNVHGWIGLERVFERNAPSIGVGIRP